LCSDAPAAEPATNKTAAAATATPILVDMFVISYRLSQSPTARRRRSQDAKTSLPKYWARVSQQQGLASGKPVVRQVGKGTSFLQNPESEERGSLLAQASRFER
jgi:hypothetical protein